MSEARPARGEQAKKRILVVDDHPVVREAVRALLAEEPDLEVCAEAASAADALSAMKKSEPDLAIVDLRLKDSSGLDLIKDIRIRHGNVPVLVLSMRDEGLYAERVLRAGARGYVTKEEGPDKILQGIRKVLQGHIYLSDRMASKVLAKMAEGPGEPGASPVAALSDRELAVFELIGAGLATRQIAEQLHISPKTVESHREHIKDKLKLDTATDLLKHAIEWSQCRKGP